MYFAHEVVPAFLRQPAVFHGFEAEAHQQRRQHPEQSDDRRERGMKAENREAGRDAGEKVGAVGGGGGGADGPSVVALGEGVFVMPGAYQGVAVEFADHSVVVDGMQSDARTAEIIRLTKEAIPGKSIRYVVNTHSHFDHANGLRQYAAEGATIITHSINAPFFAAALANPRTLNPTPTEPSRVDAEIIGIDERLELSDDSGQRLDVVPLAPSPHAADMLIAYLPGLGTVIESDILQPWINPIFAGDGDGPHPYLVYLDTELERLGLDVARFVPIHTPPEPPTMPRSALDQAVGR